MPRAVAHARFLGQPRFLNCLFGVLYLLLTRRLAGIVLLPSFGHLAGLTPSGNLVHFKSLRTHDTCLPFWFKGQYHVLRPALLRGHTRWLCLRWGSTSSVLVTT